MKTIHLLHTATLALITAVGRQPLALLAVALALLVASTSAARAAAPTVMTGTADPVGQRTATLNGAVDPQGATTLAAFAWGRTTSYTNLTTPTNLGNGSVGVPISARLTGLIPATLYHYCAIASNSAGFRLGLDRTFTTDPLPPAVTTLAPGNVTSSSALLRSTVNPNKAATIGWFEWGTSTSYGNTTASTDLGSGTAEVPMNTTVSGLAGNTTYHCRAVASNVSGIVYGANVAFTTPQGASVPSVTTGAANWMQQTSAIVYGSVNPHGAATSVSFDFGITTNYGGSTTPVSVGAATSTVDFQNTISNLLPATLYHYRANASNVVGLAFGLDETFTTRPWWPLVYTDPPTNVTSSSALLWCIVDPNKGATVAWFEWGTNTSYGNATASTNLGSGTAWVPMSTTVSGLAASTTYHWKVVASNAGGLVHCPGVAFTTAASDTSSPSVTTLPATEVTANSAMLHAMVHPNGWPVTAWFRWGILNNYDHASAPFYISQRTNIVPLNLPVTGLVAGTVYRYQLVITNGSFSAVGAPSEFITPFPPSVSSLSVSALSATNATLQGSVNPNSLPSSAWIEWGTTTNYGNASASVSVGSGNANVPFTSNIAPLSSLRDYHFRLVASNAAGVAYGPDRKVSTPPGTEVADGIYVSPTLLPANQTTRVTVTAWGRHMLPSFDPGYHYEGRLTQNGQVLNLLQLLSYEPAEATFRFPSVSAGFYGFLIRRAPNTAPNNWETIHESGPRLFHVVTTANATVFQPAPKGSLITPANPTQFIATVPRVITGVLTGAVTVPQQVQPLHLPPIWDPSFLEVAMTPDRGVVGLGWTHDFDWDGEGTAGIWLTFEFPMQGVATFTYSIPYEMTIDFPTNVYAGQDVVFKAREFRFLDGSLQVQHSFNFSTEHGVWINVPYDLMTPPLDLGLRQEPDRLLLWGTVPLGPSLDYEFASQNDPFDSSEIFGFFGVADPFSNGGFSYQGIYSKLGGHIDYSTAGSGLEMTDGCYQVSTAGSQDGWQDLPPMWDIKADQIEILAFCDIPYVSAGAAILVLAEVELWQDWDVNVRSRDVISVKPPYSYDFVVHIPEDVSGNYTVTNDIPLHIDATLGSHFRHRLSGGIGFDMPFVDYQDLASWNVTDFWAPEVLAYTSPTTNFNLNIPVSVTGREAWILDYLWEDPVVQDYELRNFTLEEAAEELTRLAGLAYKAPSLPPMVPSVSLGTFPAKPESEFPLMLSCDSSVGGTIVADPPPVDGGYAAGTMVTLTAVASPGYKFISWSGDTAGTAISTTVAMSAVRTAIANFETVLPLVALVNPSFEADTFTVWPGYRHNNGPITGWTAEAGMGINPVSPFGTNDFPFADNGAIPDGRQVAFLQQDGALRQVVGGLTPGAQYRVEYWENARQNGYSGMNDGPVLEVRMDSTVIDTAHEVRPLYSYRQRQSQSFTATSAQMELAFVKVGPSDLDRTVLIDNVRVILCGMSTRVSPTLANGSLTLSWNPATPGATLESADSLEPTAQWTPVPGVVNNQVTMPAVGTNRFYRLRW